MVDIKIDLPEDFLQEEERCDYLIPHEMKKVWAVQLDLIQELLRVCEKHGLRCFADGGTLLGTIRHKGYIPWDDDIDIIMLREDYDKLVKISPEEIKGDYLFQTAYTDKDYIRGHAQLRNVKTTAILNSEWDCGRQYNKGIFIDVFVLDGVSDDACALERQRKMLKRISNLLNFVATDKNKLSRKGKLIKALFGVLHIKREFIFAMRENVLRKQSIAKSNMIAPLGFVFETEKLIKEKSFYDEILWMDFEMIKLPVPSKYHEILQRQYGDYMKPQRCPSMHGGVYLDVDRSYLDVLAEKEICREKMS